MTNKTPYSAHNHMPVLYLILLFLTLAVPVNAEDWTMTNGMTYNDVTIKSVDGDTVTISDQNGTDLVSMKDLPPKLQKKVGFFAAKANGTDIPAYFHIEQADQAEALARQLHVPVAWMCSFYSYLDPDCSTADGGAELTRMALATLQGRAIVIFSESTPPMPANVHHDGFSPLDDGPLPDGANFLTPKIVFSSPDTKQLWGRVSHTQMKATGKDAIISALDAIDNDPAAQAILSDQASSAATGSKP